MVTEIGDLVEEQRRIEEEAMLTGYRASLRATAKAQAKGREQTTGVGMAMVKRIVGPMEALLREDQEKRGRGRATSGGPLIRELREVDPRRLCLAATRAALQQMSRPQKLTQVARTIGEAIEDELRWHRWEHLNKAQAEAVRRRVAQSPSIGHRRNALAGFARRWEARVVADKWTEGQIIALGTRFVDYLVRLGVMELIKISMKYKPGKPQQAAHGVQLTAQTAEWAKDMGEFLAVSRPLSWPLVIPPVPWTRPVGGGFHFREGMEHPAIPRPLRALPLVGGRRVSKEQKRMLEAADLTAVYAGVNAAQATAWRVNPKVYPVLVKLLEEGRGAPGLTPLEPREVPERLHDEEAKDKERLIAHKAEIRKAKRANSQMFSRRMAQHRVFSTARKFVAYREIYFAYNLDFRGRVYANSYDLSPQGDDLQRGLLEFAHGDPLDASGVRWLAIHLANTWGFDKASFDDRERWAYDNEAMILRVAEDPLEHRDWYGADKKTAWQFLAACFAWKEYRETGLGTICRTPVMLDGSCSGIQHYAALLRDEQAGPAVNLVPRVKPGDLYGDVATATNEYMDQSSEPWALEWRTWRLGRKEVKRSVMTLAYGVTFISHLDYVRDSVRERMQKEGRPSWLTEDNEKEAFVALAKFVWRSMRGVVKGPLAGMHYVKRCVNAWADHDRSVKFHWTSPCGFPVVANYLDEARVNSVEGQIGGATVLLKHYVPLPGVTRWSDVGTSVAPNFVHSLDASHLLLSLKRSREEGVTHLAAVHDALGTTPTKTAQFAQILRDEFAALYASDPFECLRASLRAHGATLPEAPQRGTLDTAKIAQAEYLFS